MKQVTLKYLNVAANDTLLICYEIKIIIFEML